MIEDATLPDDLIYYLAIKENNGTSIIGAVRFSDNSFHAVLTINSVVIPLGYYEHYSEASARVLRQLTLYVLKTKTGMLLGTPYIDRIITEWKRLN